MTPEAAPEGGQERVLVVPATRRDGTIACDVLRKAGIACRIEADLRQVAADIRGGVGALILTDVALAHGDIGAVIDALGEQPDWSDVPVVVMSRPGEISSGVAHIVSRMNNVTLLDRPTSVRTLTSAVHAALRARRRQYQIRDQMQALRAADEALRVADRRKDEFLATLAHELRNPLAPLRSALQVMERSGRTGDSTAPLLALMDRQMNVMVRLIDDLLDVARISSGKVVLKRERLDLRAVVESALEGARPGIDAARHQLAVTLPPSPVWVMGDPTRLAQVAGNLLNNATKYTPNGGAIEVSLVARSDLAELRVADNGAGIPPPMLAHVFDMFAQVNRTLDRSQGGLGIGLSLVRRLMEMHGGSVVAESAGSDRGSVFTIRLPMLHAAPAAEPAPGGDVPGTLEPPPGVRVLVVDDNRDAADTLAMVLAIDGYDTRTEYAGEAAIAAAMAFRPRVIFCDIGMPGLDGHEVAVRLRASGLHARTVLVALTGWGTEEDKRQSRDAGFDFHLTKPVSSAALAEVLEQVG